MSNNSELPPWSSASEAVQPGEYRNESGEQYIVLGVARHSESLEELVVCCPLSEDSIAWVQPLSAYFHGQHVEDIPEISDSVERLRKGRYRHYSGNEYEVLVSAYDTTEGEEVAVYRADYDDSLWVRPLDMFLEDVEMGEYRQPRFAFID